MFDAPAESRRQIDTFTSPSSISTGAVREMPIRATTPHPRHRSRGGNRQATGALLAAIGLPAHAIREVLGSRIYAGADG